MTFVLPLLKYDVPFNPFQFTTQIEKNGLELSTQGEANFLTNEEVSNPLNSDIKEVNENKAIQNNQLVFSNIDWWSMAFWIYLTGMAFFMLKFSIQWISLLRFFSRTKKSKEYDSLYISPNDISPFSFFNKIVVPSNILNNPELKVILSHEKIHQQSGHTFDVFMSEFIKIIHWFNPVAWVYNKLVRENLEYLADAKIVQNGFNKQDYQTCLINNTFQVQPLALVNSFANSLIKKRLIMMNKQKSSALSLISYVLFLIPLFVLTSFFNIDSIRDTDPKPLSNIEHLDEHYFIIGSKATLKDLTKLKEQLVEQFQVRLVFDELEFNDGHEISTLNVTFYSDGSKLSMNTGDNAKDTHIYPFFFKKTNDKVGVGKLHREPASHILIKEFQKKAKVHLYGITKGEFETLDLEHPSSSKVEDLKYTFLIDKNPSEESINENLFPINPEHIREISEKLTTDSDGTKRMIVNINLNSEEISSLPINEYPEGWLKSKSSYMYGLLDQDKIKNIGKQIAALKFEPKYYIDGQPTSKEILNEYENLEKVEVETNYLSPKNNIPPVTQITEVRMHTKDLSKESKSDGFGTIKGKKMATALDDGSRVWMNSSSFMTYSGKYPTNNRDIILNNGEFYFKMVEHNYLFNVMFKNMVITGNSQSEFNINGYTSDKVIITLVSGDIKLFMKEGDRAVSSRKLNPGNSYSYNMSDKRVVKSDISEHDALAWKRGELNFKSDNIETAVKKLERWYGINIFMEGETSSTLTGSFKNQPLEETLKSISKTLGFDYTINDKDVSITF